MDEDSICFLAMFEPRGHGVVEGCPDKLNIQPLAAVVLDVVYLDFGSGGWHEDCALDLKAVAAVGDSLGVVAGAGSDDPALPLLLCEASEGGGGSPDFEAADDLEIFSLEVDVGAVLTGEEGGLLERRVGDYFFVFAVGLVDLGGRHKL